LTSSPVFSRADTATDSETFYVSILDLLDDEEEQEEVRDLLIWWNRYDAIVYHTTRALTNGSSQVFPSCVTARRLVAKDSALARIKARRAVLKGIRENTSPSL
jgi:hypothetical protein